MKIIVNYGIVANIFSIIVTVIALRLSLRTRLAGFIPTFFAMVLIFLQFVLMTNLLKLYPNISVLLLIGCVLIPASEELTRSFFAEPDATGLRTAIPISLTLGGLAALTTAIQSHVAISQGPVEFGQLDTAIAIAVAALLRQVGLGLLWTRLAIKLHVIVVTIICFVIHSGSYFAFALLASRPETAPSLWIIRFSAATAFFLAMYSLYRAGLRSNVTARNA